MSWDCRALNGSLADEEEVLVLINTSNIPATPFITPCGNNTLINPSAPSPCSNAVFEAPPSRRQQASGEANALPEQPTPTPPLTD